MRIIGVDLHTRQQSVAMLDTDTGEVIEKTLEHEGDEVREFYSALPGPGLVGIEATGSMPWFLKLMEELKIECRVGHPAEVRAAEPRKQKHDRRDARLLLNLLAENRFPQSGCSLDRATRSAHVITASSPVGTDADASATHTAISGTGYHSRRGATLWSQVGQHALQALPLAPFAGQRRAALLGLYPVFQKAIDDLDQQVSEQALLHPQARRLMTHPGVGPVTALATEVFLGDPLRFVDGKAVASYIGLIPSERSSGGRQRLGKLSKEGNALVRYLWGEATIHAVRRDPELKRFYRRKLMQKGLGKAKTAAARKLGIRLWIMLRDQIDYKEFCRRGQLRQKSGETRAGMPGR